MLWLWVCSGESCDCHVIQAGSVQSISLDHQRRRRHDNLSWTNEAIHNTHCVTISMYVYTHCSYKHTYIVTKLIFLMNSFADMRHSQILIVCVKKDVVV